ncbi:Conserved_hypothetical protein [Hexamita inflata]|uniref:Uncharacterized protein n=1 Tax=Hexamita inflata TaxID=28002 RepID=A0AA86PTZ9_9EUKA|nr:Conserved hypothetical protein [Hexamita inflata]
MRGTVIPGHRVASGLNNNPKYPGGTLRMQLQFFKELGLDLSQYYLGTLNIQTSSTLKLIKPFKTFENVKWCEDPAETFSFIQILLECKGDKTEGLIYWPHPETKPFHFQDSKVVEVLTVFNDKIKYGDEVTVHILNEEARFE